MRTSSLVSLVLSFLASLSLALDQPQHTLQLHIWPFSASTSIPLAEISYNATAATLKSYTNPSLDPSEEIVRLGFHHPDAEGKDVWSGIVTSASNFAAASSVQEKRILLHVNEAGEAYHVGFRVETQGSSGSGRASVNEGVSVEVVRDAMGAVPKLNRPIVMDKDGKVPSQEPEKSFFQKYVNCSLGWANDMLTQVAGTGGFWQDSSYYRSSWEAARNERSTVDTHDAYGKVRCRFAHVVCSEEVNASTSLDLPLCCTRFVHPRIST